MRTVGFTGLLPSRTPDATRANALSSDDTLDQRVHSVGRPYPGYTVRVEHENGELVGPGETGQLLIGAVRGLAMFQEYVDNPQAMAEIRAQLQSPAWNRIVGVRSKREHENAEVYIKSNGDQITSLVIVAADPNELTFVSIDGPIKPEDLADLGGQFHIPEVEMDHKAKSEKGATK